MTVASKRCLITGVSSGLGRAIAEAALARGDHVVGTVRSATQTAAFEALASGRASAILLDVTDQARIAPAVAEAVSKLGGLDILVNNAGFGATGAVEETAEEETRAVFDTNFFGALSVTRACLPALRASHGHVVAISSLAGQLAMPGFSAYCASKFAVEAAFEALASELEPFGVGVTIVEPGAFRTSLVGTAFRTPTHPMALYDNTPARHAGNQAAMQYGKEPGDPAKAAAALLQALCAPNPPLRLALGNDAVGAIRAKLASIVTELDQWEELSRSTDFEV